MAQVTVGFDPRTYAALTAAIKRNPTRVRTETGIFLSRGIAAFNRSIIRSPWRVGGSGGGAPVSSGQLRDTHQKTIGPWEARITPTANHAIFVHEGTRFMEGRPWLDYAKRSTESEINLLGKALLDNIVKDLAQ